MPSARYYQRQAKTLLSWARATKDRAYADRLRAQAAKELEQADQAREAVADLNSLLIEFNSRQLLNKDPT
jgi:transposase